MRFLIISFFLLFNIQLCAQNYQKTLIIGALPFNAPFSNQIDNRGHFVGFDIELMNHICERINARCLYKGASITQLFTSIKIRQMDLAIGGLIITKQRQESYLFSMPYLMSYGNFVVLNKSNIKSINDLYHKKIGVLKGSVYQRMVMQHFGSNVTIIPYPLMPDILSALVDKQVDAVLIDQAPAKYWTTKENNLKILGKPMHTGSGYAIMTNKKNTKLIREINSAILNMEQDGSYLKLYNEYFN